MGRLGYTEGISYFHRRTFIEVLKNTHKIFSEFEGRREANTSLFELEIKAPRQQSNEKAEKVYGVSLKSQFQCLSAAGPRLSNTVLVDAGASWDEKALGPSRPIWSQQFTSVAMRGSTCPQGLTDRI